MSKIEKEYLFVSSNFKNDDIWANAVARAWEQANPGCNFCVVDSDITVQFEGLFISEPGGTWRHLTSTEDPDYPEPYDEDLAYDIARKLDACFDDT